MGIEYIYQHVLETFESLIPEDGVHTVEIISNRDTVEIDLIEYRKGSMLDMENRGFEFQRRNS